MERLTVPDKKIDGGLRRAIIDAREVRKEAMTIYWALKKYEDTELTPEQIMELKEAVQKLENIFGDEITINQVIDFSLISILHRVIQTEWKKQNC